MDPAYITPFITSIQNVFSTMLQLAVTIGEPRIKTDAASAFDVSGIIGMTGDVTGSVTLSFPKTSAERVVSLFTGTTVTSDHPDFADAVGELVNMVAGGAKALFPNTRKVSISCPSVVVGEGHTVARQRDLPVIVIPCTTDCGELVIEIGLQERPASQAPAPAAVARA